MRNRSQALLLGFLPLFLSVIFLRFVISVLPCSAFVFFFLQSSYSVFWNREQFLPICLFSPVLLRGLQNHLGYFLLLSPDSRVLLIVLVFVPRGSEGVLGLVVFFVVLIVPRVSDLLPERVFVSLFLLN